MRRYSCPSVSFSRFAARRRRESRRITEAAIEIKSDLFRQMLDAILKEMVCSRNHRMLNRYALLSLELFNEAGDFLQRRDAILISVHAKTRGGTRCQKRKIEAVGGGRYRDKTLDFRPPHQELHADPGAERYPRDPGAARFRIERLRPVKGRRRVR